MSHVRFWQKTYLLTFGIVLVALLGGLGFIGWQNQQQTLASYVDKAKDEQLFIAQNLARDLAALDQSAGGRVRASALARSYGSYYARSKTFLEVTNGDEVLFSNLPGSDGTPLERAGEPGTQTWSRRTLDGMEAVVVTTALTDEADGYTLSYATSLEPLLDTWRQMRVTLVAGSVIVSLALAVALFFALRSLSRPLERLAATANTFAAGDSSARATVVGNDEVGMLAASFNAMADTAVRDIDEIGRIAEQNGRMAASLSHEIRTPLTAIRGYAEYLRIADASVDERDSALRYVVQESKRLQSIAQRMLQLFSLEADEIERTPVDLAEVARCALHTVRPIADACGVALKVDHLDGGFVQGDRVLLESLVTNLLDNAVGACDANGQVRLSLARDERTITMAIADTGRGLSPTEIERLGEPFYRPDKARSRARGGAGLGVAISRRIAEIHGADLCFQSQEGIGTTVEAVFTAS